MTELNTWGTQIETRRLTDIRGFVGELWRARRENNLDDAIRYAELAIDFGFNHRQIVDFLAMTFYDTKVKTLHDNVPEASITELHNNSLRFRPPDELPLSEYGIYPYRLIAMSLAKHVVTTNPELAIQILDTLNPNAMRSEAKVDPKMPSDLLNFYLRLTKSFQEAKCWHRLVEVGDLAIESANSSEHQHWIVFRVAKAALELNDIDRAKQLCQHPSIPKSNRNWDALVAQVDTLIGNHSSAILKLKKILFGAKDLGFQVNNLALLSQLMATNDIRVADSLTSLEANVRESKGWPLRADLRQRLENIKTPPSDLMNLQELKSWMQPPDALRATGKVIRHLTVGSGYISVDGGSDIYFSVDSRRGQEMPPINARVSFEVEDSFDKKKNRPSQRAVQVKQIFS
jgi:hypothetical protein